MFKGTNLTGFTESAEGKEFLQSFSPVTQQYLDGKFCVATPAEVERAIAKAKTSFEVYKSVTPEKKAVFLETIAEEILQLGDILIQRAMLETGLTEARLTGERGRTMGQLKLFAALLREGSWVEAVIDPAQPERKPLPRADLRKMLVPIGPIVVFGASNFPFAFSTAGGDSVAAWAAGNPVIVKAHASHLGTNELVGGAIKTAAEKCGMPDGLFSYVIGKGAVTGMQLVKHPAVKAVGFTGSYQAGMAIYKAAVNERKEPIPVYAEMSSINPVLVLPHQLQKDVSKTASLLAGSVTLGVGQFCTNPGLIFLIENDTTETFTKELAAQLAAAAPGVMLNKQICNSYYANIDIVAGQEGVTTLVAGNNAADSIKGSPALLEVSAAKFIANADLQTEIFGPATMIIRCKDQAELLAALGSLHGQLTGTVIADESDLQEFSASVGLLTEKVGRILFNGVPTGVEVCHAMVHGGPFPSTSFGGSTSVGTDAIKRFTRPVCWQDCPPAFLPDALKDDNPLHLMRKVNGVYTRDRIV